MNASGSFVGEEAANGVSGAKQIPNEDQEQQDFIIQIQKKAMDDIINVNSLFTVAVFVGLSAAGEKVRSLDGRPECDADIDSSRKLVLFEVLSFACFLFSSLIAKTSKIDQNVFRAKAVPWNGLNTYRSLVLQASAMGSSGGCVFLTLSMLEFIQIRLGKMSCMGVYTLVASISLIVVVSIALILYVAFLMYAIRVSMKALKLY